MPQLESESMEWKSEISEFLWEATSEAMRTRSRHLNAPAWKTRKQRIRPIDRNETLLAQLRLAQKHSYRAMERLIGDFMTPEKLFFEHLGQPCLEGGFKNCWNGYSFYK